MNTVPEALRLINNLIRIGVVHELDAPSARVRVAIGDIVTDWLPWAVARAGADRSWWAPSEGEQVLVLSPGGDLAAGVVIGALYQSAHPAPAADRQVRRTVFANGTVIELDQESELLMVAHPGDVELAAAGNVSVEVGGDLTAEAGGTVIVRGAMVQLNP
ncbi:MAG: phage baseplate assembly protein V [Ectothiorhodospiraceae bacterium]|nr:phage baseplate assembly protein V [Ectothiorhodospiraceae bacterium]